MYVRILRLCNVQVSGCVPSGINVYGDKVFGGELD